MSELMLVICSLLGVIGLIFLTYYATRWLNKKFRSGGIYGSGSGIKIIECVGIAQDKQLIAVKAGNKAMLLGVTPQSVTKLSDLDESDIEAMLPNENTSGGGFAESLKKAFANRKNAGADASDTSVEDKDGNA